MAPRWPRDNVELLVEGIVSGVTELVKVSVGNGNQ